MPSGEWNSLSVEEQKGWLTGSAPTNALIANLQRLYHVTRQYGDTEGLLIKAYNMWGHDWNNVRPVTVPTSNWVPDGTLSGGLEKIKIGPTY